MTEKLDGGNTLLHGGQVYARSVSAPSAGKWMAMVKKHHAWKVTERDVFLYGEDIYGVHSIEYEPVPENETFHAFALRKAGDGFSSFRAMVSYAQEREIPVVPILFEGTFADVGDLRDFVSGGSRGAVGAGRREGGSRDTGGAWIPGRGVPVERLQERPGRARPVGRTLVEELEGVPHRPTLYERPTDPGR